MDACLPSNSTASQQTGLLLDSLRTPFARSTGLAARAADLCRSVERSHRASGAALLNTRLKTRQIPWLEQCDTITAENLVSLNDGINSDSDSEASEADDCLASGHPPMRRWRQKKWFHHAFFTHCWPSVGDSSGSDDSDGGNNQIQEHRACSSTARPWQSQEPAQRSRVSTPLVGGSEAASETEGESQTPRRLPSRASFETLDAIVGAVATWASASGQPWKGLGEDSPHQSASNSPNRGSASRSGATKGKARRLMEQASAASDALLTSAAASASDAFQTSAAALRSRLTSDQRRACEYKWSPSACANYVLLHTEPSESYQQVLHPKAVAKLAKLASQDALKVSRKGFSASKQVSRKLWEHRPTRHEVEQISRRLWQEAPDLAAMSVKLWQEAPDTRAVAAISKLWQEAPALAKIFATPVQRQQSGSEEEVLRAAFSDSLDPNLWPKEPHGAVANVEDGREASPTESREPCVQDARTLATLQGSDALRCHMLFASPLCIERLVVVKLAVICPVDAAHVQEEVTALGIAFEPMRPHSVLKVATGGRVAAWNQKKGHPEEMVRPGDELVHVSLAGVGEISHGRPLATVFRDLAAKVAKMQPVGQGIEVKLELVFRALRALPPLRITDEIAALKASGCEVVARTATAQNMRALVASARCRILHMSLHCAAAQQHLLFLEDGSGKAHVVRSAELQDILGRGQQKQHIDIVFLNSCHSMSIGKTLVSAGVRHVVCVRDDDEVRDESCRLFARDFFGALRAGRSVQEAFDCGRAVLSCSQKALIRADANAFTLLPEGANHDEVYCEGGDQRHSTKPSNPEGGCWGALLPPVEDFLGREVEVHQILRHLNLRRFLLLCGLPGAGKTALLAEVGRFVRLRCEPFEEVRWVDSQDEHVCRACIDGIVDLRDRLLESPQRRVLLLIDDPTAFLWAPMTGLLRFEFVHMIVSSPLPEAGTTLDKSIEVGLIAADAAATKAGLKPVRFPLGPLEMLAQAQLFLQRAARPLYAFELWPTEGKEELIARELPHAQLLAFAETPRLRALGGNPRRIIAAAQALDVHEHSTTCSEPPDVDSIPGSVQSTPRNLRRVRLVRPDGRVRDEWLRGDARVSEILLHYAPKTLGSAAEIWVMGCRADPSAFLNDFPDDDVGLLVLELRASTLHDW